MKEFSIYYTVFWKHVCYINSPGHCLWLGVSLHIDKQKVSTHIALFDMFSDGIPEYVTYVSTWTSIDIMNQDTMCERRLM